MPGQIRPGFDSPALRCAKQFVAMCMALAIAAVFQILILRQPARQTLRQRLARISWQLNGLGVLLSYLTEAVMPMVQVRPLSLSLSLSSVCTSVWILTPSLSAGLDQPCAAGLGRRQGRAEGAHRPRGRDPGRAARPNAYHEVRPLPSRSRRRSPVLTRPLPRRFASVEPTFGQPFKAPVIARIIRSHQLILDRLREARTALGEEGFSPEIRKNFSDVLVPYRKQAKRVTRALSYLCVFLIVCAHSTRA